MRELSERLLLEHKMELQHRCEARPVSKENGFLQLRRGVFEHARDGRTSLFRSSKKRPVVPAESLFLFHLDRRRR
jgi:hypothetical protein